MERIILFLLILGLVGFVSACGGTNTSPENGQNLAVLKGCAACHSVDNTTKIALPWKGLYGSQVELNDGNFITVDDAYLIESIKEPNAKIVKGFTKGAMPPIKLTEDEINALVAYVKSVR
jgi:cytochrome c oxidase subunit II